MHGTRTTDRQHAAPDDDRVRDHTAPDVLNRLDQAMVERARDLASGAATPEGRNRHHAARRRPGARVGHRAGARAQRREPGPARHAGGHPARPELRRSHLVGCEPRTSGRLPTGNRRVPYRHRGDRPSSDRIGVGTPPAIGRCWVPDGTRRRTRAARRSRPLLAVRGADPRDSLARGRSSQHSEARQGGARAPVCPCPPRQPLDVLAAARAVQHVGVRQAVLWSRATRLIASRASGMSRISAWMRSAARR